MTGKHNEEAHAFSKDFPHLAEWVLGGGRVEIGCEYWTPAFVRALDEGGLIYEGKSEYSSLEEALRDLDKGIGVWIEQQGWSA